MVTTKTRRKTSATTAERTAKTPKGTKDTEGTNEKYEEIKKGDMHITALQKMTIKELQDAEKKKAQLAKSVRGENIPGFKGGRLD